MIPSVDIHETEIPAEKVRVQCPLCKRGTFLTMDDCLYKHSDGPMGLDTCVASGLTLKRAATIDLELREPHLPGVAE